MKITAIQIRGLFEIFDYGITFPQGENALIITGPNGYGKTTVLNILFNLFSERNEYFHSLIFNEISIQLDTAHTVKITKKSDSDVEFAFWFDGNPVETFHSVKRAGGEYFSDTGNSAVLGAFLQNMPVHLIREQRLLRKVDSQSLVGQAVAENQAVMVETIQTYADELRSLLAGYAEKSVLKTQQLDSSYPLRLRTETQPFTQSEYEARYRHVIAIQEKLANFGLYRHEQEIPAYSDEDKKALTVYLKDLEIKLAVFADILEKLALFTTILNERRFNFKTIQISPDRGFYFKTSTGKELDLAQLSSGEQHEVVLLYELIFNVTPDTLVLIDEPEISLHISWQKEFLADLLRIIKIQNIQVIVATHSPAIINGRWDLTYNLEKKDAVA